MITMAKDTHRLGLDDKELFLFASTIERAIELGVKGYSETELQILNDFVVLAKEKIPQYFRQGAL